MLRHNGLIGEQKRNGCHGTDFRRKTTKQQDDISAQCNFWKKILHKKYKNYYQNVLEILGRHKKLYNSVISELEAETKS
jgi:predicted patatin/cPLA2 family phospholipase